MRILVPQSSPSDDKLLKNDWWATVYTSKEGANYGALFCVFNVDGLTNRAHCYFKDVDGKIPDEFTIIT